MSQQEYYETVMREQEQLEARLEDYLSEAYQHPIHY